VPLSATVCIPAPLLLTSSVAVFDPVEAGLNTTLIVQWEPTAIGAAQVLVCENWPGFVPENVMLVIGNAAAPIFVTVTGMGALATRSGSLPNANEDGDTVKDSKAPVPLSATV